MIQKIEKEKKSVTIGLCVDSVSAVWFVQFGNSTLHSDVKMAQC